ncbi:LysR family transcriptional regulator [Actinoallomurus soli]|uniref:LysR family transcriptional regulator n=1 Tax=Actinoallomurus soli TaxID=2952535 RepID=UPI0020921F42|nr:LysR family transcriptional regulator [Actinoallomurus soli]MCO5970339.1 LysR family transcriptional regulator [Actinoallomurus soli]
MELDPRRLLLLRAIADGGSLAAAARALGHTPSAVSQQLSRLERDVGMPLVDRAGGPLRLTVAGRLLADSGERIAEALTDAARRLSALSGRVSGPVSIGAPLDGLSQLTTDTAAELTVTHPALVPRFVETAIVEGLHALRLGDLDVLLVADDLDTALPLPLGVRARVLFRDEYRIVVPDGWPAPRTVQELSGRPWITMSESSANGRAHERLMAAHGIRPSLEHCALHQAGVRAMVAARLGATVVPAFVGAQLRQLENATITDLPVTGYYIVRVLWRTSRPDVVAAADAAADAVMRATHMAMERAGDAGMTEKEPTIRVIRDPSEQQV